jgi:hypothetical protein
MLIPMQQRFTQLLDPSKMPVVFLHGSPHVDNYSKSGQGAAMVDFDRSRFGPYAWDLVRFMVSLSLRRKRPSDAFLEPETAKQLRKGYLRGFRHPDQPFSEMRKLKDVEPEPDQASTDAYVKAGGKWVTELRANKIPNDDPDLLALLRGYGQSRGEDVLQDYYIEEAGGGEGSMGFRKIYLVVLAPRDPKSKKDRILLNIKEVRSDPDDQWFKNPFTHHGKRMLAAAELYAPGWETRSGYADLNGIQYHVRQVPPMNVKLKKMLDLDDEKDLAYAVGTQLGRAHRLSLKGASPEALEAHLAEHYPAMLQASETIADEIASAHKRYLKKMNREGLEPKFEDDVDE